MYGIVLTGGGARGAYGIGALECIRKERLGIGAVVGSSVGAINGAVFAQGDFKTAQKLWSAISINDVVRLEALKESKLSIKGIQKTIEDIKSNNGVSMEPVEMLLREIIDENKLLLSPIDFGLVTYSVTDHKPFEVFKADIPRGKLVDYIMASACLPGTRRKVIGDKEYLDGGFADNKPVGMLVNKGYRDIVVVDVGGLGVQKQTANNGVNIIEIKCKNPIVGMMEFDKKKIEDSVNSGYVDARKAFGRAMGKRYAVKSRDYIKAKHTMGDELLSGLEKAADYLGVYRFREYTMCELIGEISEKYNSIKSESVNMGMEGIVSGRNKQILFVKATEALKSGNAEQAEIAVKLLLKDFSLAANAIRYFSF